MLAEKIMELESKLNQANEKISDLTTELKEEKFKNMKIGSSTTSDETKKLDSGSFEKLQIKPIRTPIHQFQRNRSSDVTFRSRLNKQAMETLEDAEFQKLEAQAMYETKNSTNSLKDRKKEIHQTFLELKMQRNLFSPTPTTKASPKRPSK